MEAEIKNAGLWRYTIFQPRLTLNWDSDVPIIEWWEADQYYGRYVIVEGIIVDTYNSGKACFLNFHQDWKLYFTVVIFACDFPNFPAQLETYYLGKKVQVIGVVKKYKNSPEIIVKTSDQIRILE
jgi:micrococcal nuclease